MLILLGTTITTSFFDSLNPSAIAQQMLLQVMVKNKRHIFFFIFGIGLANLGLGLAVYYGVAAWASQLLSSLKAAWPLGICGVELTAGLFCLAAGIRLILRTRRQRDDNDSGAAKPPARISPLSLFLMGAAFCAVELTSALPYFGFLAVLASYRLAFFYVLCFMILYDFVYISPLLLLYWGYNRLQSTSLIRRLEHLLVRVSAYVVPVAVGIIGILLLLHSVVSFIYEQHG